MTERGRRALMGCIQGRLEAGLKELEIAIHNSLN